MLSGCGERSPRWHETDIAGAMPGLAFRMERASDGATTTERDYRGRIVILYFGYTHCPDICPATLANLSDVMERLGSQSADVQVLFVTVDPARDTLALLHTYVGAFSPRIDGLRGDADALARLARRYRVAYSVTPPTDGRPYSVMHSDAVFFFDRDGHARLVTTSTDDTVAIAEDLRRLIGG
jgi:protein SCO1/2